MQSHWLKHKNQDIFVLDYTGFHMDRGSLYAEIEEAHKVIVSQPENSLLTIIDVQDTVADVETVSLLKSRSSESSKIFKKTAVVGVSGVKKVLAESIIKFSKMKNTKFFDDYGTAKDWLVEE